MAQHQRITGPTAQNNAATFEPSMSQGAGRPHGPRLFSSRLRQGVQISQTTHVQAAFTDSMSDGYEPFSPRLFSTRLAQGVQISQPTHVQAAFIAPMVAGSHPDQSRARLAPRIPLPISQPTFIVVMTPDMFKGNQPDTYRAWLAPRIPLPLNPAMASNDPAASMSGVNVPDLPVLFKRKLGLSVPDLTFMAQMTPEQFKGWMPDRARFFLAPRLPQPLAETEFNNAAPLTQDMVEGWTPDRNRAFDPPKRGWETSQPTFLVVMTPEVWKGNLPDKARIFLAPRIPLPISQTSHVQAAFGQDMVEGWQPDQNRAFQPPKRGWDTSQPTFIVQMTPEMFKGWQPEKGRLFLAPRIPLPLSQTSHQSAPITADMLQGYKPERARFHILGKAGLSRGFVEGLVFPWQGPVTVHAAGLDVYLAIGAGIDVNPSSTSGVDIYLAVPAGTTQTTATSGLDDRQAASGLDAFQTPPAGIDDAM